MKLKSFDGLGMIPIDILQQGCKKIVQYMLDLFRSPEADPLYRTKLMVVGYENVGKTTILDCLFPLEGWLESQGLLKKTRYWFKLQGRCLSKYEKQGDSVPHKNKVVILENRQWEVTSLLPTSSSKGQQLYGIKLTPNKKIVKGEDEIEIYCPDKESHDIWLTRLKRVCMNEATHGIEIQSMEIDNSITQEYFSSKEKQQEGKGKGKLSMSVWDFAGQQDYYNNHHYFLSTRTVFMVLWKLSEWRGSGGNGLKGLEFWFRSLATHLSSSSSPSSSSVSSGKYFSVIVVGTFLDHASVHSVEKSVRVVQVNELARECGLKSEIEYYEVSCSSTLENIGQVQEIIFKTALSHSYMGERVPKSYLTISEYLGNEREEKKRKDEIPLVDIKGLTNQFGDEDLVKRALGLLSLWGECVYFDSPPELASLVILDPRFLAKGILADLFNHDQNTKAMRKDGVIKHADLVHIWSKFTKNSTAKDFSSLATTFMTLLEKLGVCFVVGEDKGKPFMEQRSIIPALLPDQPLNVNPVSKCSINAGAKIHLTTEDFRLRGS